MTATNTGSRVYEAREFSVAVWLAMKGLVLDAWNRAGRRFIFKDPNGRGPDLVSQWWGSEACKYDAAQRGLKAMLHSTCDRHPTEVESPHSEKNLALAAWLRMHGLECRVWERRGKTFFFVFEDPEGRAAEIVSRWAGSEASHFDSVQRSMKRQVTGKRRR